MVTVFPSISAVTVSCGLTRGFSCAMASDAAKSETERIRKLRYFILERAPTAGRAPAKKWAQSPELAILSNRKPQMKTALVLILLLLAGSLRANPAAVANQARAWRIVHEKQILGEFAELLSLPNLASDAPNIQRNAEAIKALCEKRGLTAKLVN